MATKEKPAKAAGISTEAVQAKTGKGWAEWCAILDAAGAQQLNHKGIVAYLDEHYPEMGGWWMQMVTVGYEQARGLRDKHEKPDGYSVSGSKTIAAPVATLYKAWLDQKARRRWLPHSNITIRKATLQKSMRITWVDGKTYVDVNFYPKGEGKTQIAVQHSKLTNPSEAAHMKTYWAKSLDGLKNLLES